MSRVSAMFGAFRGGFATLDDDAASSSEVEDDDHDSTTTSSSTKMPAPSGEAPQPTPSSQQSFLFGRGTCFESNIDVPDDGDFGIIRSDGDDGVPPGGSSMFSSFGEGASQRKSTAESSSSSSSSYSTPSPQSVAQMKMIHDDAFGDFDSTKRSQNEKKGHSNSNSVHRVDDFGFLADKSQLKFQSQQPLSPQTSNPHFPFQSQENNQGQSSFNFNDGDDENLFDPDGGVDGSSHSSFDFGNPRHAEQLQKSSADLLNDSGFEESSSSSSSSACDDLGPEISVNNLDKSDVFGSSIGALDIWAASPEQQERKSKSTDRDKTKSRSKHRSRASRSNSRSKHDSHSSRSTRSSSREVNNRRSSTSRSQSRSKSPGALSTVSAGRLERRDSQRKSKGSSSSTMMSPSTRSKRSSSSSSPGVLMAPLTLAETTLERSSPSVKRRPSLSHSTFTSPVTPRSSRSRNENISASIDRSAAERLDGLLDDIKGPASTSPIKRRSSKIQSLSLLSPEKSNKVNLAAIRAHDTHRRSPSGSKLLMSPRGVKTMSENRRSKARRSDVQESLKLFLNDSIAMEEQPLKQRSSETGSVQSVPVDDKERWNKKERQHRSSRRVSSEAITHRDSVRRTSSSGTAGLANHLQSRSSRRHRTASGGNGSVNSAPAEYATPSTRRKKELDDRRSKQEK